MRISMSYIERSAWLKQHIIKFESILLHKKLRLFVRIIPLLYWGAWKKKKHIANWK